MDNNTYQIDYLFSCILKTLSEVQDFNEKDQMMKIRNELVNVKESDIENIREVIIQAIIFLVKNQETESKFIRNLKTGGLDLKKIIDPKIKRALGSVHNISPYPLYICPVEPSHYRKRLKPDTDFKICPLHNVNLVEEV